MNNKQFDQLFDELKNESLPSINPVEKELAIKYAEAEFSQAFSKSARPKEDSKPMSGLANFLRSLFMSPIHNKLAYGVFTTVAIAFVLLTVFPLQDPLLSPVSEKPNGLAEVLISPKENKARMQEPSIREALKDNDDSLRSTISKFEDADTQATAPRSQKVKSFEPRVEESYVSQEQLVDSSSIATTEQTSLLSSRAKITTTANQARSPRMAPGLMEEIIVSRSRAGARREDDSGHPSPQAIDREEYAEYQTNTIIQVDNQPVSTFSIDVDTASYSLVRNQLKNGALPKPEAVRAEEFINYFDYDYALPKDLRAPFKPTVTVLDSPWNADRKLVHIGIKGVDIAPTEQPDSNIVFLLDVSGSMNQANKLPLVKQSMALLLETLKPTDLVSIIVYAGAAGVVLEPTAVKDESKIMSALQQLQAGGSTAGGAGIRKAYQLAEANFIKEGVNRIILATDGDFNVGQRSNEDLKALVERKRRNGVFLSVLGFGRNNYQDDMMQTLAQNGNGVAAYIDTLSEAQKVLVDEATSTLFPIAKDVKIQVEFNPATVSEYRLIGYETRALNREDFNNDKVDAGDIGAGHTVTAIYEITPADGAVKSVDELRYQQQEKPGAAESKELGYLKLRYKLPSERKSRLIETPILGSSSETSRDVAFSIAVAGFAQLLMNSPFVGDLSYDDLIHQAQVNKGEDQFGYRAEFIQLVRMAKIAKP